MPATQSFDFQILGWGEMVTLLTMKTLQHPDVFQDVSQDDFRVVSLQDTRVKPQKEFTRKSQR